MDERKTPDNKKLEWLKPELVELGRAMHISLGALICQSGSYNILGCGTGSSKAT